MTDHCLVTAASGFIGKRLVGALAAAGFSGVATSRRFGIDVPADWRCESRFAALSSSLAVGTIIHLEVKQHVQNPTAADLEEFESVNVGGTQQWLEWASAQGVNRFIFFSSIKAVGSSAACQDESTETLPETPYGQSKRRAEALVRSWADGNHERTAIILRPAVVYGPGNKANMFSFVDGIHRHRFFLVGRNENIKSLVSIRNLVAAVTHLLNLPIRGTEVFFVTDKESYSVSELASLIQTLLNQRQPVRSLPLTLARSAARFGDLFSSGNFPITTNRLKALLETTHFSSGKLQRTGFVHPQSTREGLKEMIDWYLCRSDNSIPVPEQ